MGLNGRIRRTIDTLLERSPAQPLFLWRASRRLLVLAYHDVADAERFASHVEYLRTVMHPVSLGEVVVAMNGGRALPQRAVLITFDDGHRSVYDAALPIMKDGGLPGVTFVVAGVVGTHQPFWWDEVEELVRRGGTMSGLTTADPATCVRVLKRVPDEQRRSCIDQLRGTAPGPRVGVPQLRTAELLELDASGIEVANHTYSHPCLDRSSAATVRGEIRKAHEKLSEVLGRAPTAFAYPNGNQDPRVPPILADLGYEAAFLFDHRVSPSPPPYRYRISRVRVASTCSIERFRILTSGLHSSVHHLIRRP